MRGLPHVLGELLRRTCSSCPQALDEQLHVGRVDLKQRVVTLFKQLRPPLCPFLRRWTSSCTWGAWT